MIFMSGHGRNAQPGPLSAARLAQGDVSAAAACGSDDHTYPAMASAPFGCFDYLFPDAPVPTHEVGTTKDLDKLADAMVDQAEVGQDNSEIPALFTYIGQFIDHDITAGTDRETDFSSIDLPDVPPLPRDEVAHKVANLRTGALDLDSLYGGAAVEGPFSAVFKKAMRYPDDPAQLFLGTATGGAGQTLPIPNDPARDLLRLDWALRRNPPSLTQKDLDGMPAGLRELFFDDAGALQRSRAIIGDARNDENLGVAQFHMTMARFHNKLAVAAPANGAQARFAWAQKQVRWFHQWLVVNEYLARVCDPAVLADTKSNEASVYRAFVDRIDAKGGCDGKLPLPLEFSVASFRFGHTMARPSYDWNPVFGREEQGLPHFTERSDFRKLFQFTGNPRFLRQADGSIQRVPSELDNSGHRLPKVWVIEMRRMMNEGQKFDDRNTRRIDTHLAPPLLDMDVQNPGMHAALRHLARRNLRRGQRLNLPTAQSCIAGFVQAGINITPLNAAELKSGQTGHAMTDQLAHETPLWFYILKEAELLAEGQHLGPLGSRIVAETLIGLVVCGPGSYWTEPGSDHGRWHPRDGAQLGGRTIDSYQALIEAAGMW